MEWLAEMRLTKPRLIGELVGVKRLAEKKGEFFRRIPTAPSARLAAAGFVALMAVGSLAVWTAIPAVCFWLAATLGGSRFSSFLIALVICPIAMVLAVQLLHRVDSIYGELTGRPPITRREGPAWLRSMRGERVAIRQRTILQTLMSISAVIAMIALTVWFFLYAGSPLPV